jgi:hypothetical protein
MDVTHLELTRAIFSVRQPVAMIVGSRHGVMQRADDRARWTVRVTQTKYGAEVELEQASDCGACAPTWRVEVTVMVQAALPRHVRDYVRRCDRGEAAKPALPVWRILRAARCAMIHSASPQRIQPTP